MEKSIKKIVREAQLRYVEVKGNKQTAIKLIEEMGELIQALAKKLGESTDEGLDQHISEEIAHVLFYSGALLSIDKPEYRGVHDEILKKANKVLDKY